RLPTNAWACIRRYSSVTSTTHRWPSCWMRPHVSAPCSRRQGVTIMSERLREQQFTLARHLRDPAGHAPPPGIENRRLQVYRELFYGAIEGLLAGSFPVIRRTLGEARWHARVRDFYAHHRCQTPLFTEIAEEFVAYLQQ